MKDILHHLRVHLSRHWVYVGFSLLFLLATSVAQLNFAMRTPQGFLYTGANAYAAADKLVYKNMIQQGREGRLFMRNVHTIDSQQGLMLSPLWYVIGQTAGIVQISNTAAYQLYRVLFTALFCWLLYRVLGHLFARESDRILAALFVFFSGGFGWLYLMKNPWLYQASGQLKFFHSPVDLYVTEGNTLLNFAQAPLFSFSQVAMLASMYLFVRYREKIQWHWDILTALIVLMLGIMHPYDIPVLFAVLGSWTVWHIAVTGTWLSLRRLFFIGCAGAISLAYNLYALLSEPVLSEWYRQNLVFSPPVTNYLWAYGLLGILALVGCSALLRQKKEDAWWAIILLWCVLVPLFLYLPLEVSRRFINGWHIALAIVAYYGSRQLYDLIQRQWLRIVYACMIALSLGSSLGLYLVINLYFDSSVYAYGYYYLTPDERAVIAYLRTATTRDDHILTSDAKTSFTLTSELDRLVFRGHDHQTPQVQLKQQQMDWFFAEPETEESIAQRRRFLQETKIDYIVASSERLSRSVLWLDQAPFMENVFSAGALTVYRVAL